MELQRRKLQIEQLAFEISDVAKARDKILQELAHANMAANEPATEQVNARLACGASRDLLLCADQSRLADSWGNSLS